ncbi:alpha/beta fold hydrolase [Anaerorhabdus sp.]|uniref:alpha/beta fold hydrolase n=1 Tax=Anaerorhabdus sp. TaxID=1872524 RepID=UPI002FCC2DED
MDIQLYETIKGNGETIILLHGNNEDHTFFVHQIYALSRFYRVIALDTRGHGRSQRGKEPFTIRQFVQDVYEYMEQKQIEQAHLLGFSDGGNIALLFAIQYPKKVKKLIIDGANLDPSGVKKKFQIPTNIEYYISNKINKNSKKTEMLRLMVNDPYINHDDLKKIQSPTLVVAGTKDDIKESHTRLIATLIPNSKLCFIDGDHFVAYKNPSQFNDAILTFLND